MSSSTTGSTIYRTLPRWCLSTMSKLCLCLWCSWCFSTLSELGSACGCGARGACLLCPIRGVVRLSGTFWLVLSSFFRWQVPSVNLPKLGLDCPPDSTRLLTQICDQIGSTSHVVTMACTNITINVSICARIRPRALTNKSQNCGNSESCDKICIKFWLLFT